MKPFTDPDKAVTRNAITCLVCGQQMAVLKRHLKLAHDLEPHEYREMFNLSDDYPLTAPYYEERKTQAQQEQGTTNGSKGTKNK